MTNEVEINLGLTEEGSIGDLILGKNGRFVDPMSINEVSLRRNGETFTARMLAYENDEEITVELTREEVLEALEWESI